MDHPYLKHTLDLLMYLPLEGCWQSVWWLLKWRSKLFNVVFDHCRPSLWLPLLSKDISEASQEGQKLLLFWGADSEEVNVGQEWGGVLGLLLHSIHNLHLFSIGVNWPIFVP